MRQIFSLCAISLRLLVARPGPGVIIVLGMVGLVAVALSLSVIATAFEAALVSTGKPDRALVLRAGSTSEINGSIPLGQYALIRDLEAVDHASRETYITVNLPMHNGTAQATLPMRGTTNESFTVRPEVELVAGRAFAPGKYELIAGVKAAQIFAGLEPGKHIQIRGQSWLVTGLFSAEGSAFETELWVDERLLAQALGRGDTFSSMLVQLTSAGAFEGFRARLAEDRRLTVAAHRESTFYADQAGPTTGLIRGLGWLVGIIMALGALTAALNTMQSAMDARAREVAVLQALGFERLPLLVAVLIECTLLSLLGAAIAVAVVYLLLDGATLSTVAAATSSGAQVAFRFTITANALVLAAALALVVGLLGGLVPGYRAIKRPVARSLRA